MKPIIAALVVLALVGCSNMSGKSSAYQEVHQRAFWSKLNGGGDMSGGAQAWANLYAHEEAERVVGK